MVTEISHVLINRSAGLILCGYDYNTFNFKQIYTEFDFGLISFLFHSYVGGPGSGKLTQSQKLLEKNPGWVHLSMGDLLRAEVAKKGSAGAKWGMIGDLVSQGEMAPEVFSQLTLILVKNLV